MDRTNALIDDMLIFIRNSISKYLFNVVSTCRSNKQIIFSVQFINSFLGAFTTLVRLEVGRGRVEFLRCSTVGGGVGIESH